MNANEKIYVKWFDCHTEVDDYEKGQQPNSGISWNMKGMSFDQSRSFGSVGEALEAVCECMCFKYVKENWIDFGKDFADERGRFDGDVLVDVDNNEAGKWDVEKWKAGEKKLWNCHIRVYLVIGTTRDFTESDQVEM